MRYTERFLGETLTAVQLLDTEKIEEMVSLLADIRQNAGMECYSPSDNVSELTARINDDGWESCYANWLRGSRINPQDAVFVFSVGGGNRERQISMNLVRSLELAERVGARVLGVVGRDGGYTAQVADACLIIPTISDDTVTPLVAALQAVVWHLLVSHPRLKANEMKWESEAVLV